MYFTVVVYFYTCISSFADTFFFVISWQDYDVEFINKNGSSLKHIRERIAEFLVTQVIDPKVEFYFE
jgi:hypothetical protein